MELTTQELKAQLIDGTFPGMIPMSAAAELLGMTKAGLMKKVRSETTRLELITLNLEGVDKQLRGVTPQSLSAELQGGASLTSKIEKQALARLRQLAAKRKTEEYAPFMERLGLTWRNPQHRKLVGEVLGELSRRICDERREAGETPIAVSALVVLKSTGMPNESFFGFARNSLKLRPSITREATFDAMKELIFDSAGTW